MPSDDVAVSVYVQFALPTSICPYVGAVEVPVPPPDGKRIVAAFTNPAVAMNASRVDMSMVFRFRIYQYE